LDGRRSSIFFRSFFIVIASPMFRVLIAVFAIACVLPLRAAGAEKASRPDESKEAGPSGVTSNDYLLVAQDVIRVEIYQEPDLKRELKISAEGMVELPLIGRVELKGKTVQQAEELIRKLYDKDYLVEPQINLSVLEYAPRTVEVFGAVNNPGVITFPKEETLTLTKAISLAGSFSRLANTKEVTVRRKLSDGNSRTFGPINVKDLTTSGRTGKGDSDAENFPIQPGDVIYVPERII
jgi:polysaccharide biosynthesis/export protein